ncbi:MAG: hypothetical protein ABGX83_08200 [Nitrospira sp.]|nr:hypothetical protein [Candidatus Manganitrophaceae bacterium]HIL34165.1 hypothetical protein [Candidatus Manganitrophaceae bacterium]
MQTISNTRPDLFSPLTLPSGDPGTLSKTQSSQYTLQVQKRSEITLFTQEGDKVTLSSSASLDVGFATYNSQGLINGAVSETSAEAFYLNQEFGLELTVEGDLNEQELKDIVKALKTVKKLSYDFFSGRTDHAIKRVSKLNGLETISGFDVCLQYDRSASVQTASTQVLTPPSPAPIEEAGLPQESADLLGGPESKSTLTAELGELVQKMEEVVVNSPAESATLTGHVNRFLEHFLEKFSQNNHESQFEFQVIRKIQVELVQRFVEAAKSEETGIRSNAEPIEV